MSLRDDLIRDEGLRLKPYKDILGIETIGVGRNLQDVGITEAEAMVLLDNDIAKVHAELAHALPWLVSRPQGVQDAIANCCFNMGLQGLMTFRTGLACLQAGDYAGARAAFADSQWARQVPARAARVIAMLTDEGE